jgi:hypothetical protein
MLRVLAEFKAMMSVHVCVGHNVGTAHCITTLSSPLNTGTNSHSTQVGPSTRVVRKLPCSPPPKIPPRPLTH